MHNSVRLASETAKTKSEITSWMWTPHQFLSPCVRNSNTEARSILSAWAAILMQPLIYQCGKFPFQDLLIFFCRYWWNSDVFNKWKRRLSSFNTLHQFLSDAFCSRTVTTAGRRMWHHHVALWASSSSWGHGIKVGHLFKEAAYYFIGFIYHWISTLHFKANIGWYW